MSAQHTAGPWTVENATDICGTENDPDIGCVGSVDVAHVYLRTAPGRTEANARLIAAAPDMLAALIVAREFISTDRNSLVDYYAALLQIDAAITNATA